MSFSASVKDPQAVLDYAMDWSDWLQDSEVIMSQNVTAEGATVSGVYLIGNVVRWRLAGGQAGRTVPVKITVSTSLGQIDERTVFVPIQNR